MKNKSLIHSFKPFLSWSDYYHSETIETFLSYEILTEKNETINITTDNAYVYECFFQDMHSKFNGGAISFFKTEGNFLIERCSFLNCSSDDSMGAVRVTGGNSIIAFSCCQNVIAKIYDGFCGVHTDSNRNINSVFDSSISHCEAGSYNIMVHVSGPIHVESVNLSQNIARYRSALTCWPTKTQSGEIGSDISYCSFTNNTARNQYCIYLTYGVQSNKHVIQKSNIIENKAPNTIYSNGETKICQSYIQNNGKTCFSQKMINQNSL